MQQVGCLPGASGDRECEMRLYPPFIPGVTGSVPSTGPPGPRLTGGVFIPPGSRAHGVFGDTMNQPLCGPDTEASGEAALRGAAGPGQDKRPAPQADTSALFLHKEPVGPEAALNNGALCSGPAGCGTADNRDKRQTNYNANRQFQSSLPRRRTAVHMEPSIYCLL